MKTDCERSGLSPKTTKLMRLTPITAAECAKKYGIEARAYEIPYYSMDRKPLKFCRVRLLEAPKGFKSKKLQRYTQPKGSEPHLYFPPNYTKDWVENVKTKGLIITEGEKKAARVCLDDTPCIGLGGVWSFRSKTQLPLLTEFDDLPLEGTLVTIIYDSDLTSNTSVQLAMSCLANELLKRGAKVFTGHVPPPLEGSGLTKQGLDDYLESGGALESIELAEYELSKELWALNEEVAFIKTPGQLYQLSTRLFFSAKTMKDTIYADRVIIERSDDEVKYVSAIDRWIKWPQRRAHTALVYSPGEGSLLDNGGYNLWRGYGLEPSEGDIAPWTKLLDYVFKDNHAHRQWFMQWLAYPLQNPGAKLFTASLLWSRNQGTGKTFIGYIVGKIYGDNFCEIGEAQLHDGRNSWAVHKQFILGDEVTGTDKRRDADRIKSIITRDRIYVNAKYQPEYYIRDCINYLFTSQWPDAFMLEDKDRRFFVHEITGDPLPLKEYAKLDAWYRESGPAHLYHHLLHEIDCSTFSPTAPAPQSVAKEDMIRLSKTDLDLFCERLVEAPNTILVIDSYQIDRDLYTAQELVLLYDPTTNKHTTEIAMSKALRRNGFVQLPATLCALGTKRLWAIRNIPKWLVSGGKERAAHYDSSALHTAEANRRQMLKLIK